MENEQTRISVGGGRKTGLIGGVLFPLRGAGFIFRHPRLTVYAAIPFLVNLLLFTGFFFFSLRYFNTWLEKLMPQGEAWYWVVLTYLATVVFGLALLLLIGFTFTLAANIIASPFNDALSAKTETLVRGRETSAPFSLPGIIRETGRTVLEEVKKIVFYLAAMACLLLLNLIPVAGQILYVILGTLLTITWLALEFLDYSLSRNQYRFGEKLKFIKLHIFPVFGFGLGVFVVLLIPVINLFLIPMAVVAATLLYVELAGDRQGS